MADLQTLLQRYPGAETFRFGDNADLSARLLALVAVGKKTATCGAAVHFDRGDEQMPKVGRRDVALHWDGRPAIVIETVDVQRRRFCDVDADFALAEGENESLEGWRRDHQAFFEREGTFSHEMPLICERFQVVEVVDV